MLSTTRRLATVAQPGHLSLLNATHPSRTSILAFRRALRTIPNRRQPNPNRAEPELLSEQDSIAYSLLHNGKPPKGDTRSSAARKRPREEMPRAASVALHDIPTEHFSSHKPQAPLKKTEIDLTTAAAIRATGESPWPRPEELPWWASEDYFNNDVGIDARHRITKSIAPALNYASFNLRSLGRVDVTFVMCILHAKLDGETITLKVIGRNKARSQWLAYSHLVAALRAKAADETLYTPPWLFRSKSSLVDVFEHCANLGLVPVVRQHRPAQRRRLTYECTIEWSIEKMGFAASSGQQKDFQSASRVACAKFWKNPAHTEMEEGQVKRSSWINRLSAARFIQWLRQHKKLECEIRHPPLSQKLRKGDAPPAVAIYKIPNMTQQYTTKVHSVTKDEANILLEIAMAVVMSQKHPDLLAEYMSAPPRPDTALALKPPNPEKASDKSTQKAAPTKLDIWHYSLALMQHVPDLDLSAIQSPEELSDSHNNRRKWSRLTEAQKQQHSQRLLEAFQRYERDVPRSILNARRGLPVAAYKSELIDLVDSNVYSIFIGATGSGKTTQVPRLIFEDWCRRGLGADCNIICTQPRVIAATSVASRVGDEMGRTLKERVGFHVRHNVDVPQPRDGSITFCTTGILLQQIQHEPDYIFDNVSHLILDEVHERDLTLDFTLAVLKRAIADRLACGKKVPRILLMSATLDEEMFKRHFQNVGRDGKLTDAPSLSVPGRTFPVTERYLEDVLRDMHRAHKWELDRFRNTKVYGPSAKHIALEQKLDAAAAGSPNTMFEAGAKAEAGVSTSTTALQEVKDDETGSDLNWDSLDEETTPIALIAETIAHVLRTTKEGAVLVFLPGLSEIRNVEDMLHEYRPLGVDISDARKYRLFQLHSSISDSQKTVFKTCPPGVRKIILSSPIAETSVTIPDVTVVIDSGQVRETQYDNTSRASWLRNSWIHGSSAKQRAGRAGRVQAGIYLAMYSKARRETMPFAGIPELGRSDLQSTCLAVKSKFRDVDVPEFLASALDPPSEANIAEAMKSLVDTGALTPAHELTSLGHILSRLSIHPSLGKMIVLGIVFKCLDPIVVAGAAFEQHDLWSTRMENARLVLNSKKHFANGSHSDSIATYQAYCYLQNMDKDDRSARERAMQEGFQWATYQRLRESIKAIKENLRESGVLPHQPGASDDQRVGGKALNVNSHKQHVIKAVLVAGLQSNIGGRDRKKDKKRYNLGDRPDAAFSMGSLFSRKDMRPSDLDLVTFGQLAASKHGYVMQNITYTPALTTALFGCTLTDASKRGSPALLVNNFLPLPIRVVSERQGPHYPDSAASAVLRFRTMLDRVLDAAFENLARIQRGAMVSRVAEAAVEDFMARVVEVLTEEAMSEDIKQRLIKNAPERKDENGPSSRRRVKKSSQKTAKGPRRLSVPSKPRSPNGEAKRPDTNPAKDLTNSVLKADGRRGRATSKGTVPKNTSARGHKSFARRPWAPPRGPETLAVKPPWRQSLRKVMYFQD